MIRTYRIIKSHIRSIDPTETTGRLLDEVENRLVAALLRKFVDLKSVTKRLKMTELVWRREKIC